MGTLSRDYKVSMVESKEVRAGTWGSMSPSRMNRLTNRSQYDWPSVVIAGLGCPR